MRASSVVLTRHQDGCSDGFEARRLQSTPREMLCRQCRHLAVFVDSHPDLPDVARQQLRLCRGGVQVALSARQMAHDVVHMIGDAEHDGEDHDATVVAADEQRAIVGPDPDARSDGVHEQTRLPVAVCRAEHEKFSSVRRQGCHVAAVDDQLDRVGTDDITEVEDGDQPTRDDLVQSVGAVQSEGPLSRESDPFHGRVRAREAVESLQHAVLAHVVDQRTALDGRPVHDAVGAVREVSHAAAVDDDDAVVAEGAGVDQDVVVVGAAPQLVQRDGVRAAPLPAQAVHTQTYFVFGFTMLRLLQDVATEPLLL